MNIWCWLRGHDDHFLARVDGENWLWICARCGRDDIRPEIGDDWLPPGCSAEVIVLPRQLRERIEDEADVRRKDPRDGQ